MATVPRALLHAGKLLLASVVIFAIVLARFSPHWVLWQGLWVPDVWQDPTVNRAVDTLRQLDNPWTTIDNPSNKIIENRLLFPLLGHYLGMSLTMFLAIPFVGCVAVVLFCLDRIVALSKDWLLAILGTAALCTTSWFFTSTGWLAYFDSWFVLSLLAVTACPSLVVLVCVCLLAPWVDERFLLGLPLALAARMHLFGIDPRQFARRDLSWTIAGCLPYVLVRVVALLSGGDRTTSSFLQQEILPFPALRYLEGAWAGFRAVWLLIAIRLVQEYRTGGGKIVVFAALLLLGTLLVNFQLAGDLGRGVSVLIPAAFLSVLPGPGTTLHRAKWLVGGVLLANLLLPASHVVTVFTAPIHSIAREYEEWKNPPIYFRPEYHLATADALLARGNNSAALQRIDIALQSHPEHSELYNARGSILFRMGRYRESLAFVDRAVQLDATNMIARFNRGLAREKLGDTAGALADYEEVLRSTPRDWPQREQVEKQQNRARSEAK